MLLQEWAVWAVAEPRDLGKDTAGDYVHSGGAAGISDRETKPGIPAPWTP